jgi:ankyrin repeat protein
VNAKTQGGLPPLDWAIALNHPETVSLLRKRGGKTAKELKVYNSIHEAAEDGNIEVVKRYLAAGTDVNAKNIRGTPLHDAAASGHKEIVELLINEGADVNAKRGDGSTPLHRAAYKGHKELAELLIAGGAYVNAKTDVGGRTPLDMAILFKHIETADLLRKHGGKTGEELKAEGK